MDFGIFDHVDASGAPLQDFYDNRLKIVEAYDRGGFYCYHVAEHHQTPLGLAASPAVYLAGVAQRTKTLTFGPLVYTLPLHHPLVVAEGASEISRRAVGTPVFWGMLAASTIGIFMIPMLYVVFQSVRERVKRWFSPGAKAEKLPEAGMPAA